MEATTARKFKRNIKVLTKNNWECFWCGSSLSLDTFTKDHFVPKAKGGANALINLIPSCFHCNVMRGSQMPGECEWKRLAKINRASSVSATKAATGYYNIHRHVRKFVILGEQ